MNTETAPAATWPVVLHFGPLLKRMSDDEFFDFCQMNGDLRIERSASGELSIMVPTGGESGNIEFRLSGMFWAWVEADGTGVGFSSSTAFRLPNGATRSADVAWVNNERWERLTADERKRFPPLCPDFVAEVRSESDSLSVLQAKMVEYMDNGARLGWLIDPQAKRVHVYRPNLDTECQDNPPTICGDPVLPGFVLDVQRLWT